MFLKTDSRSIRGLRVFKSPVKLAQLMELIKKRRLKHTDFHKASICYFVLEMLGYRANMTKSQALAFGKAVIEFPFSRLVNESICQISPLAAVLSYLHNYCDYDVKKKFSGGNCSIPLATVIHTSLFGFTGSESRRKQFSGLLQRSNTHGLLESSLWKNKEVCRKGLRRCIDDYLFKKTQESFNTGTKGTPDRKRGCRREFIQILHPIISSDDSDSDSDEVVLQPGATSTQSLNSKTSPASPAHKYAKNILTLHSPQERTNSHQVQQRVPHKHMREKTMKEINDDFCGKKQASVNMVQLTSAPDVKRKPQVLNPKFRIISCRYKV